MLTTTTLFGILIRCIKQSEKDGLSIRGFTRIFVRFCVDESLGNFDAKVFMRDCGYTWDMVIDGNACPTCMRGGFAGNGRCIC